MKLNKIAVGLFAVMLTAPSLLADINIYLTGSTAFRSAVYNTINSMYQKTGSPTFAFSENTIGNATASKGTNMTWSGTMPAVSASVQVNVFASWSGSAEGVSAVVQGLPQTYLTSSTSGNTSQATHVADIAFSDVYQDTTGFTAVSLQDDQIGIVPFAFARNVNAASAGITNVTHQIAQTLLGNGKLKLRAFTGVAGDAATTVFLVGRNGLSGTRQTVQAETGYGALSSSKLYSLTVSTNLHNWTLLGDNGYDSGGKVSADLNDSNNNGPAIGYLGAGDLSGVNGGANNLPYEGVLFDNRSGTANPEIIYEGKYSLWGYEHLMYDPSNSNVNTDFVTAFEAALPTQLGPTTAGLNISQMKVGRNSDGGKLFTLY